MADIELVIKINEEDYATIMSDKAHQPRSLTNLECKIANGIPLPKGHGDLKDADKLKHTFIKWSMAVQGNFTDADIARIICNSPTIIKADKGADNG